MDERNAKVIENTDIWKTRLDYLNRDISWLDTLELTRYLITLIQEINKAKKNNEKMLWILWWKIPALQENYEKLLQNGNASEKTRWIMERLTTALQNLKDSLHSSEDTEYKKLQYELTEQQLDNAIEKMEKILWNNATTISIWIEEYSQSNASNLYGTINDVMAVNEKLKDYSSKRNTTLLNEVATKEKILDSIRNSPKDKWLFLYFAGHGIEWHIIPYSITSLYDNKEEVILQKCISPQELFDAIGERNTIVIVDKCYGWDLTLLAPKNITIVSATDSASVAGEQEYSSNSWQNTRNASRVNEGNTLSWREEVISSRWTKRWKATYGMTDSEKQWLDLKWFVSWADWWKQNPTISSR